MITPYALFVFRYRPTGHYYFSISQLTAESRLRSLLNTERLTARLAVLNEHYPKSRDFNQWDIYTTFTTRDKKLARRRQNDLKEVFGDRLGRYCLNGNISKNDTSNTFSMGIGNWCPHMNAIIDIIRPGLHQPDLKLMDLLMGAADRKGEVEIIVAGWSNRESCSVSCSSDLSHPDELSFVTNTDRIVSPEEAFEIALKNKQIKYFHEEVLNRRLLPEMLG